MDVFKGQILQGREDSYHDGKMNVAEIYQQPHWDCLGLVGHLLCWIQIQMDELQTFYAQVKSKKLHIFPPNMKKAPVFLHPPHVLRYFLLFEGTHKGVVSLNGKARRQIDSQQRSVTTQCITLYGLNTLKSCNVSNIL